MAKANFTHKCDTCLKHIATCKSHPVFVPEEESIARSVPSDMIVWCGEYEARAPEQGGEMRAEIERLKEAIRRKDAALGYCIDAIADDEQSVPMSKRLMSLGGAMRQAEEARALLASDSAEPAEERGPEVGE